MKLNTLFVAAVLASSTLSSCVFKTANERQLKYTHTSLADGDAFAFFKEVGSIAPYEVSYAKQVETVGSANAKEVAGKVSKVFSALIPQLDSLATKFHVDFPINGAEEFTASTAAAPAEATVVSDSLTQVEADIIAPAVTQEYSDDAYLQHVQHQVAKVKDHFKRLSRNTNEELRDYASAQLGLIDELYLAVGGKADEHAHH